MFCIKALIENEYMQEDVEDTVDWEYLLHDI